jgi:hypothetical protein
MKKKANALLKENERVVWKSGEKWKSGTIIAIGKTKEEAIEKLGAEYKLHYASSKEGKPPFYLVAADTPLFKPGYTVHSVPEHHLQLEKESWVFKKEKIESLSKEDLLKISIATAKLVHEKKSKAPEELTKALNEILPESFS